MWRCTCWTDNAKRGISPRWGPKLTLHLTPSPKINQMSPLIINNLHIKFESDRSRTVSWLQGPQVEYQIWPWPLTPWPKINRVLSLIMTSLYVKFESDKAIMAVCMVPTRFYENKQIRRIVVPRSATTLTLTKVKGQSQGHGMASLERACHKDHTCQISMLYLLYLRRY